MYDQATFVDRTQLDIKILAYRLLLHTLIFLIGAYTDVNGSVRYLSNDDIEQTFSKIGYRKLFRH